jgi:hypothetical protein
MFKVADNYYHTNTVVEAEEKKTDKKLSKSCTTIFCSLSVE